MATLLHVHHTTSPAVHSMFGAVQSGATDPQIEGVDVVTVAALEATAHHVLAADGYLLGTPANLGYMSGALKHFFDLVYYPCLDATVGRPYGLFLHGNDDVEGARRGVERIVTGLQWKAVADPVAVIGAPDASDRAALVELGGVVAANLLL